MTSNFHHINPQKILKQRCVKLAMLVFLFFTGCNEKTDSTVSGNQIEPSEKSYDDGTYCADVTYYNPNTGTTSEYTLNVEVEDNAVTEIQWPNGGWLDNTHFSPEELDENGYCSFESDRGYEYEVQITGSPCSFINSGGSNLEEVEEEDQDKCIRCGNDAYNYRMYCKECIDEDENTCGYCGGFEYYVYRGKCSSCKRKDDEVSNNDDW